MVKKISTAMYLVTCTTLVVVFLQSQTLLTQAAQNVELTAEGRIIRNITNPLYYERQSRPLLNPNKPIVVNMDMMLRSLVRFNDERQRVSLNAYLTMTWQDEFIAWNPADYEGITEVVVDGKRLWRPDIDLHGSLGGVYDVSHAMEPHHLRVTNTGNISWFTNRVFVRPCNLDMTYFPYDHHVCRYRFESLHHDLQSIVLKAVSRSVDMRAYWKTPDGLWDILDASSYTNDTSYNWSSFVVQIVFKRKPLFYLMNIIIPCVYISFLVPLVFYLPPMSDGKVSMGISVLLAFTVFQLVIAESLPKISDETPVIIVYLILLLLMSATAVVLTVVSLHVHFIEHLAMPKWLHVIIFDVLGRLVCYKRKQSRPKQDKTQSGNEVPDSAKTNATDNASGGDLGNSKDKLPVNDSFLPNDKFRTSFQGFMKKYRWKPRPHKEHNFSEISFKRNRVQAVPAVARQRATVLDPDFQDGGTIAAQGTKSGRNRYHSRMERSFYNQTDKLLDPYMTHLEQILECLLINAEMRQAVDKAEQEKGEWKEACAILDTFFLRIYLILNILAVILFFGIVPTSAEKAVREHYAP